MFLGLAGSTQDSDGFYLKGDTSLPGYAANQPWDFHPTESWDEGMVKHTVLLLVHVSW